MASDKATSNASWEQRLAAARETKLRHEDIAKRLESLKVSFGEELLMPALAEVSEEPSYRWLR